MEKAVDAVLRIHSMVQSFIAILRNSTVDRHTHRHKHVAKLVVDRHRMLIIPFVLLWRSIAAVHRWTRGLAAV